MDTFLSVCLGLGLAAACGFRIFVPFLVVSAAAQAGMLELAGGFEWLGSLPALITFAVATGLEIAAYYVPWLDNFLDTVATPAAVVAGITLTASAVTGIDPLLKWTLAVIAGGGVAGIVQGLTGTTRVASTVTTAGLANPVVATAEAAGSLLMSVLAIVWPLLAAGLLGLIVLFTGRRVLALKGRLVTARGG